MSTKAYVEVQDVRFTEKQLGTNARIYYTNGASLTASAVLNGSNWDVTVQIVNNVTTAAQIIAAVNASATASAVVTASLKGGSTDTTKQKACKNATLSGGAAAAAASVTIDGCMVLTADNTGTGGNAITIIFEGGATAGSETCTVATNAITVGIEDGVSTYAQVKTIIDGTGAAAALVNVTNNGVPLGSRVARVSAAPVAVSLSGGVAAAAASVVVQDITFAADATGVAANGVTVSYTTGATAGSEVVTVSGTTVTVQIENGVSTATQIAAAFNASVPAAAWGATVTGTGATAQVTVNGTAVSTGAVGDPLGYWITTQATTALTSSFVRFALPFPAAKVEVVNDETTGTKQALVSLDGTNTDATLDYGESVSYSTDTSYISAIWLKYGSAAPAYRIKAYGV